jgi:hypothetical protein
VVAFARLASFFLLFSQKKETKEKATPSRLFPEIYIIMERQSETRQLNHLAQTAACRKLPVIMQISGAVAGDFVSKALKFRYWLFTVSNPSNFVILSATKNPEV